MSYFPELSRRRQERRDEVRARAAAARHEEGSYAFLLQLQRAYRTGRRRKTVTNGGHGWEDSGLRRLILAAHVEERLAPPSASCQTGSWSETDKGKEEAHKKSTLSGLHAEMHRHRNGSTVPYSLLTD